MLHEFILNLYSETMFKEIQSLCPSPKYGEPTCIGHHAAAEICPSMLKIDHLQI